MARRPADAAAASATALRAGDASAEPIDVGLAVVVLVEALADLAAERALAVLRAEQQQRQQDRWLTTTEAAEHLAVPVKRVYNLIGQRRSAQRPIPVHKDGAHNFFLVSELDAWRRAGGAGSAL